MGQVTVAGFEFSVLWQFGSGTPFTKALGFDEYIMMFDSYEGVDIRETPGLERVIYGQPYADRLPAYHRLDLSLGRTFRIGRHVDTTVKFDLINVLDRDNLLYFDLFTLVRVDQLPRFYSLGLRIDFR
jgi:outer membrane receptor protein involved in Fe transport